RELAFALQSLSEITASPGRTRSGRSLLASPALPSSPAKRRKTTARSDPPPLDLVSPPTPPLDAEAPKAALHHAADGLPLDALLPPEVASVLDAEVLPEVPPLDAELLPLPATDGLPLDAALVPAEVASQDAAPPPPKVSHNAAEVLPEVSHSAPEVLPLAAEMMPEVSHPHNAAEAQPVANQDAAAEASPKASHSDDVVMVDAEAQLNAQGDADLMGPCAYPASMEKKKEEEGDGSNAAVPTQHQMDGLPAPLTEAESAGEAATQDAGVEPSTAAAHAMPDAEEGASMELDAPSALLESTAGLDSALADPPVAAEDATIPASTAMDAEDAATPVSTAKTIKPKRRFTRSLLGLDRETAASEIIGDASLDLSATPGRRFTRSLLKPKVEAPPASSPVVPEEPVDSTPETPPPVTKMEMKMSKKVACLSKHPGNTRDLLSTGLLEGMPVMYIIPNSKKPVLKGVIAGCNIRCFCVKCDGSKAITTYFFELHAGSSKKHPAEYIYLANGNSLRDVLRACESSPLDSLDKTIQSCIDPMLTRTRTNCLNCNGELPSQTEEQFLCHQCCPESNQPQDPTSPLACSKSSSRLTPSSKESLLKRMSASKGASTGKVTTKDTGLHKLVFKVLLDGTEVTYYVDGQKIIDGYIKDQRIYCNHCNKVVRPLSRQSYFLLRIHFFPVN
uniref:Tify domain-containing protein n=1 Tax=Aegilops tauschii subsp. strangulata TaxID=200361 RepID=A0A452XGA5_AEGTS